MIYSSINAPGSLVYDVEGRQRIDRVLMVNTETGKRKTSRWVANFSRRLRLLRPRLLK